MGDYPALPIRQALGGTIHSGHMAAQTANQAGFAVLNYAAAAWPAANRGIYIPFALDDEVTAKQMFWENGGTAGTTDIGIYDINGVRLVSSTATTNSGSIQVVNITDTLLVAGTTYYMAAVASTVTTQTYWSAAVSIPACRMCGMSQQAIGSATLPATATFAAVASAYIPFLGIAFQATM